MLQSNSAYQECIYTEGLFDFSIPGILEIVATILAIIGVSWHFFLKDVSKHWRKNKKEDQKVEQEIQEDVSIKSLVKMSGGFASDYVTNWLTGLDQQILNTQTQIANIQQTGIVTPEAQKEIQALQGKLKHIQWAISHKDELMQLNKMIVPAVTNKLAQRVLGLFL